MKVKLRGYRSRCVELYHGRYQHPRGDCLIGSLELNIPCMT